MKVGVVILNWNGRSLLETYLPSVIQHSGEHTIYVADNASSDDSLAWLENHFPQVVVIPMSENKGYAGGYNVALQSLDEDILCLLNSDVRVSPNWITPVIDMFKKHSHLGACQPVLLDDKKPDYYEYAGAAGGFLDRLAYPYCRGRIFNTLEKKNPDYKDSIDLDWASGAALFIRKEAYDRVGAFDEDYFAHQEEIDLCWRMRHAGYSIGVATNSVVYHLGGGTLATINPRKTFYNFRNSLFNIVKNEHRSTWCLTVLQRMLLDGVAGIRFLFKGQWQHFLAVIKAHFSFYAHLNKLWSKRREVKAYSSQPTPRPLIGSIVVQHFIKKGLYFKDL